MPRKVTFYATKGYLLCHVKLPFLFRPVFGHDCLLGQNAPPRSVYNLKPTFPMACRAVHIYGAGSRWASAATGLHKGRGLWINIANEEIAPLNVCKKDFCADRMSFNVLCFPWPNMAVCFSATKVTKETETCKHNTKKIFRPATAEVSPCGSPIQTPHPAMFASTSRARRMESTLSHTSERRCVLSFRCASRGCSCT